MKDLIKDLLDSTWWLVNAVSSGTDPKETNKMAADIGVKAKALADAHIKVHVPQPGQTPPKTTPILPRKEK